MTISKTSTLVIKKGMVATVGLRFKPRTSTTGITLHCSATKPSMNWVAHDVDRAHRMQGWLCIGYHFIIRRDGVVEEGRPFDAMGSHCLDGGRNNSHIGVCLIGGVSENPLTHKPGWAWNGSDSECNFTGAQQQALPLLIDYIEDKAGKKLAVEGHREVPGVKKACPSFNVQHWLKTGFIIN